MRKIGYARVSSTGQNLDRQLGALVAEGCNRVFQEKASGKSIKNRPELEKAINALGTGDVLVQAEWDRCTRSMIDGVAIIERINARTADLQPSSMDPASSAPSPVLHPFTVMATPPRKKVADFPDLSCRKFPGNFPAFWPLPVLSNVSGFEGNSPGNRPTVLRPEWDLRQLE
jgi:Resolvase, N terminal domain